MTILKLRLISNSRFFISYGISQKCGPSFSFIGNIIPRLLFKYKEVSELTVNICFLRGKGGSKREQQGMILWLFEILPLKIKQLIKNKNHTCNNEVFHAMSLENYEVA